MDLQCADDQGRRREASIKELLFRLDDHLSSLCGDTPLTTILPGLERLGGFQVAVSKAINALPREFLASLPEEFFERTLTEQQMFDSVRRLAEHLEAPITEDELEDAPAVMMKIGDNRHIFIYENLPMHQKLFYTFHEVAHVVLSHRPNLYIGMPMHQIPEPDRALLRADEDEANALAFIYYTMWGGFKIFGDGQLQGVAERILDSV